MLFVRNVAFDRSLALPTHFSFTEELQERYKKTRDSYSCVHLESNTKGNKRRKGWRYSRRRDLFARTHESERVMPTQVGEMNTT